MTKERKIIKYNESTTKMARIVLAIVIGCILIAIVIQAICNRAEAASQIPDLTAMPHKILKVPAIKTITSKRIVDRTSYSERGILIWGLQVYKSIHNAPTKLRPRQSI